jgi:hypothetical protein
MSRFKVYQAEPPDWFAMKAASRFPADYKLVADVEAGTLEEAFALTQHIDQNWAKNPGVHPGHDALVGECRSTSVGDVIVDEDGRVWRCELIGWSEFKEVPHEAP